MLGAALKRGSSRLSAGAPLYAKRCCEQENAVCFSIRECLFSLSEYSTIPFVNILTYSPRYVKCLFDIYVISPVYREITVFTRFRAAFLRKKFPIMESISA